MCYDKQENVHGISRCLIQRENKVSMEEGVRE